MIFSYAQRKHIFWKLVHTFLWNELPHVSEGIVFAEFGWKRQIFLIIKTKKLDQNILLIHYWNGLVLGFAETYFLEIGVYVSLKLAAAGPKSLLFYSWNRLVLGYKETYFWNLVQTCLWNETPQVFEGVSFVKFEWKY